MYKILKQEGNAKRAEFQKMIKRALNGEIDCIITKSISRFSGNTVSRKRVCPSSPTS